MKFEKELAEAPDNKRLVDAVEEIDELLRARGMMFVEIEAYSPEDGSVFGVVDIDTGEYVEVLPNASHICSTWRSWSRDSHEVTVENA